jgi:hypothetical protein
MNCKTIKLTIVPMRLFPGHEPVTFQSHDNKFTVAPRLLLGSNFDNI